MDEWFKEWFDADYTRVYAHRDEAEAAEAVASILRAAPQLAEGRVLDLGCGNGRHLAHLRQVNDLAFGVDLSPHLLGMASRSLRGWLLRADMRHLPLRSASLSGICLWFTPFGYFSDVENRRLLDRLHDLLAPAGTIILDVMNALRLEANLVEEDVVEREGLRIHSRRSLEGSRLVKRMTLTRLASGTQREVVESVRIYTPAELRAMADASGLILVRTLGGYDASPFEERTSPRWIGLFRKKSMAEE